MKKVVYILGAGFSAPLGLPVISNFRFRSQDMYFADPAKFDYFKDVFNSIEAMSSSKNYYRTDLFNIEEILSILEMADYLNGRRLKDEFVRYIKDVINYYTPEVLPYAVNLPSNWDIALFGQNEQWRPYGHFVASLLNMVFEHPKGYANQKSIVGKSSANPVALYGVLTLNYDVIPERLVRFWENQFTMSDPAACFSLADAADPGCIFEVGKPVRLAKLHGSVETTIVPPTWSKGVITDIVPAWNLAQRLLAEATDIRFIGFSLPVADAYIKYLLKSAAVTNKYLKQIDVICLDNDGSVARRYSDFIDFGYFRFAHANTTKYLGAISAPPTPNTFLHTAPMSTGYASFDKLEAIHDEFMNTP